MLPRYLLAYAVDLVGREQIHLERVDVAAVNGFEVGSSALEVRFITRGDDYRAAFFEQSAGDSSPDPFAGRKHDRRLLRKS